MIAALHQVISIASSFISLAWAMVSYHRSIRLAQTDKRNINFVGSVLQFLWHLFITSELLINQYKLTIIRNITKLFNYFSFAYCLRISNRRFLNNMRGRGLFFPLDWNDYLDHHGIPWNSQFLSQKKPPSSFAVHTRGKNKVHVIFVCFWIRLHIHLHQFRGQWDVQ